MCSVLSSLDSGDIISKLSIVPAVKELLYTKKVLDLRFLCPSRYQLPCFSHSRISQTYVDWCSWVANVQETQDWVPFFPLTSCVSSGSQRIAMKTHSALPRKAVFYAGFFWKRWHAIRRCQLLVRPATGFDLCRHFSCLIFLIKESLFSITLNQDLFIVQETIKTLIGCDWPSLPLWPYFCTAHTHHLCCIKLLPDPPKPNAFPLLGLGTGCTPLLGFANTC